VEAGRGTKATWQLQHNADATAWDAQNETDRVEAAATEEERSAYRHS